MKRYARIHRTVMVVCRGILILMALAALYLAGWLLVWAGGG